MSSKVAGETASLVNPALDRILDLAGEAMRSRLFVVSGDGGEEACLRPDFTVAIAREHLARGKGKAVVNRPLLVAPPIAITREGEKPLGRAHRQRLRGT